MENRRLLNPLLLLLPVLVGMLVVPQFAHAEDAKNHALLDRVAGALKSDIYRFSFGTAQHTLKNPEGFDVSTSTYDNGRPESDALFGGGQVYWTVAGETANGWEGRRKRLWYTHYDSEDFDGLTLRNLMFGAGYAIDPAQPFSFGLRLAGGLGAGLTRSSSYFDSAFHVSAEAWVSTGIQLGRITWDISVRQRKSLGANLDGRSASPSTQIGTLSVGWLF